MQYAEQIVTATKEMQRLLHERVFLVQDRDAMTRRAGSDLGDRLLAQNADSAGALVAKLARNERDIQAQKVKERAARKALAEQNRVEDSALATLENNAYLARRPPVGEGVRLTDDDFRKAQASVPLSVFMLAMLGVTLIAVVSISSLSLPGWLSIAIAVLALAVPTMLGALQVHYARLGENRARKNDNAPTAS
jgi:hypothetical protein